jgi:hypothetical protein
MSEEFAANSIAVWFVRISVLVVFAGGVGLLVQAFRDGGGPYGLPAAFCTLFVLMVMIGIRWYRQSVVYRVTLTADQMILDTVYWRRIVLAKGAIQWISDPVRRVGGIGANAYDFARLDTVDGRRFSVMTCMDSFSRLRDSLQQIARSNQ